LSRTVVAAFLIVAIKLYSASAVIAGFAVEILGEVGSHFADFQAEVGRKLGVVGRHC
jgi:galactitol-specific phosphotransferase system IIC component